MTLLPSLNGLRAFEAAGRGMTFRAAAEELGVTQGAVAQQVRGLEAQLGISLFERHSKGLEFTAAGRSYHLQVQEAFARLRDATETLRPQNDKVLISVTPTFASKWLIPNLPDFAEKHPDIDLRILATERISSFQSDGIDLAVRQGNPPFGAALNAHLLFPHEIVAVASPALLQDSPPPLPPSALQSLPKIHDTHGMWPKFLAHCSISDRVSSGLQLSQTALAIDAAVAGQGIALASRFLVDKEIQSGRLVQVVSETLRADGAFYLLTRRDDKRASLAAVVLWMQQLADLALGRESA